MSYKNNRGFMVLTAFCLAMAIGALEFSLMMLVQQFRLSHITHAVVSSLSLIIMVSPIVYYFITRRKRVEEILRESEEFRINLLNCSPNPLIVINPDTSIKYVNPALEKLTGFSSGELVGIKPPYPWWREKVVQEANVVLAEDMSGEGGGYEVLLQKKTGEKFWVEITSTPVIADGELQYYMSNWLETTKHKQAGDLFETLAESSPLGVYIFQEGQFKYVNPQMQKLTGSAEGEIRGMDPSEFIHPDDREKTRRNAVAMLKGKLIYPYEFRVVNRNGGIRWAMETVASIYYNGERAILGYFMDITDSKKTEQELQERNEQLVASEVKLQVANEVLEDRVKERTEELEAANKGLRDAQEQLVRSEKLAAIGQLAGGVGHELRNPLGAIKNAVYYVRKKVAKSELVHSEPRVIEFLDIVDDEIDSSTKIINDLLGFSRVGKPAVASTRIEEVVEAALSRVVIPGNVELVTESAPGLPEVQVDADQIQQVLVNVISNAVQAMPDGGRLAVAVTGRDGGVEIQISDTGCGMTGDTKEKIFDPLFTMKAKGIGLGLAVSKSIIDRHEGHIEVESQEGKGTTFTISIPLSLNQVPAAP